MEVGLEEGQLSVMRGEDSRVGILSWRSRPQVVAVVPRCAAWLEAGGDHSFLARLLGRVKFAFSSVSGHGGRISRRTHSGGRSICRCSADAFPHVESSCERINPLCLHHGIGGIRMGGGGFV